MPRPLSWQGHNYSGDICIRFICYFLKNQLTLMPPPDETNRGVEIVVNILVVVGGGCQLKEAVIGI